MNESYNNNFLKHVTPYYKSLGILKLSDAIFLKNAILAHDFVNNKLPSSFQHFFTLQTANSSTCTRNSSKGSLFKTHIHTKKYGENSVKHKSFMAWNKFSTQKFKKSEQKWTGSPDKNVLLKEYAV